LSLPDLEPSSPLSALPKYSLWPPSPKITLVSADTVWSTHLVDCKVNTLGAASRGLAASNYLSEESKAFALNTNS
jgi:hypothetical protein